MFGKRKIKAYEIGVYFSNGKPERIFTEGNYWFNNIFKDDRLEIVSTLNLMFDHPDSEIIIKSGILKEQDLIILDIKDNQRALIWKDERFEMILGPGLYAIWKSYYNVKYEVIEIDNPKFEHKELNSILNSSSAEIMLNEFNVLENYVGLYFNNGKFIETLQPGKYTFWKDFDNVKLYHKDLRSQYTDVSGQEIITNDRVTLRINAIVHYHIIDPVKVISSSEDLVQTLYREAQLILRSVIGTHDLEKLLEDKILLVDILETKLSEKSKDLGIEIESFGIRDIILPGEMKELMNKVIEAKKVSEANLISRREEIAAMRSQANTAKMIENNPTLMRMKELEVLEKIAVNSKLQVLLGEKGLTEKVMNLL